MLLVILIPALLALVALALVPLVRREAQTYVDARYWNPSGCSRPSGDEMKPMGFCDGSTGRAQRQLATPATD